MEMWDVLTPFLSFSSIIDLRSSSWSSLCIRFVIIASFLMVSFDFESLLIREFWYIELIDYRSSSMLWGAWVCPSDYLRRGAAIDSL